MIDKTLGLTHGAAAAALLLAIAGCATSPPPPVELALARTAVNAAQSAGANEYAALDLRAAQDKLARAGSSPDLAEAARLAEAAETDARLAEAKARNAKAQQAASEVLSSIRTLHQEIERKQQSTTEGGSQ